jgi:hypothetical protein
MTTLNRTLVYVAAAKRCITGAGGWSTAPSASVIRAA